MAALLTGQALASAERHHAEGRLPQAALLCHLILQAEPAHVAALNLLGVVLCRLGHVPYGIVMFRRALAVQPEHVPTLDRLGDALHAQGDRDRAIAIYARVVNLDPSFVAAWCKIGIALQDQGKPAEAAAIYRRAILHNPNAPKPYFNLGILLRRDGKLNEAAVSYGRAIALKPYYPEAFLNLGNVLMDMGRFADAALAYRHATDDSRKPEVAASVERPSKAFFAHAWTNLGIAFKKLSRPDAARDAHHRAIALKPDYAVAHNNLGVLLHYEGAFEEAIARHREAVRLDPAFGTAHSNLGVALKELGLIREAIAAHRCAVASEPDHPKVHFNLAAALLMAGEFEEGFAEYEWRWKGGVPGLKDRNFAQPQWDGSHLGGRVVLLHAEQGFGDTLQFVRYAAAIAERGGCVVLEAPAALLALLRTTPGIVAVVATGSSLPPFDVHLPLMSAPYVLGTRLQTIPAQVPYLKPDPSQVAAWRQRLGTDSALKVGVVWAGNHRHTHDHQRSIQAGALLSKLTMIGVQLYSLQKEPRPGDRDVLDTLGNTIVDLSDGLRDFNDTAAALMALDLVISVDTSVAHLAGALGRPVWTMLPFALDWRWMIEREDTPWYPTMRLFRQPRPGDWMSVVARVQVELAQLAMMSRTQSSMRQSA